MSPVCTFDTSNIYYITALIVYYWATFDTFDIPFDLCISVSILWLPHYLIRSPAAHCNSNFIFKESSNLKKYILKVISNLKFRWKFELHALVYSNFHLMSKQNLADECFRINRSGPVFCTGHTVWTHPKSEYLCNHVALNLGDLSKCNGVTVLVGISHHR